MQTCHSACQSLSEECQGFLPCSLPMLGVCSFTNQVSIEVLVPRWRALTATAGQ